MKHSDKPTYDAIIGAFALLRAAGVEPLKVGMPLDVAARVVRETTADAGTKQQAWSLVMVAGVAVEVQAPSKVAA